MSVRNENSGEMSRVYPGTSTKRRCFAESECSGAVALCLSHIEQWGWNFQNLRNGENGSIVFK
jgi:hypothetical protein